MPIPSYPLTLRRSIGRPRRARTLSLLVDIGAPLPHPKARLCVIALLRHRTSHHRPHLGEDVESALAFQDAMAEAWPTQSRVLTSSTTMAMNRIWA